MKLQNPKIKIEIQNAGEVLTLEEGEKKYSAEKDLSEDPNEADITLYNLNQENMSFIKEAALNEAPLEIFSTTIENPSGPYKSAFAGEIEFSKSENVKPGYETKIHCKSQKRNHREFWFQKTYAAGTYDDDIINDLLSEIGLPRGNVWEETNQTIILSKTFAGPAYRLLQRFMFDRGFYCYILDGKIYNSLVSVSSTQGVISLNDYIIAGDPQETVRSARNLIEMKTIIDVTNRIPDVFKKRTKRKRRKKKEVELYGQNDYVQYEAVEQNINGMIFPLFLQPDFNPDNIFSYGGVLYRCWKVFHEASDFDGTWDTEITTDIYDDTGGDYI